jgi:hypothetical protein
MKKIDPEKPSKVVIIHHPPVNDSKETAAPAGEGTPAGEPVQGDVQPKTADEKPAENTKD